MNEIVIQIDMNKGVMKTLWTDELPLEEFGVLRVTRASNVEFDDSAQAWFVATPDGVKIAEGFIRRSDALAWEHEWANQSLLSS